MKKTHLIGIIIIVVAIGAIMVSLNDASTYSTFTKSLTYPDKEVQVIAKLNKSKAMIYDPLENPNLFKFYAVDNDSLEKMVIFNGSKPQQFERSEQIVITGKMNGEIFAATKILMKCPSKYNDKTGMKELEVSAKPTNL